MHFLLTDGLLAAALCEFGFIQMKAPLAKAYKKICRKHGVYIGLFPQPPA